MVRFVFLLLLFLSQPAFALRPADVTSKEGATAWLVEEHQVPAFSLTLRIRHAGSAYDPVGKEGRASMAADMLMEGAGERDAKAFYEALDFYAIRMGTGVSRDDLTITLMTLSEHGEEAFSLLHDMLSAPRFATEDLRRLKAERIVALRQQDGDAGYQAGKLFYATAFAGHPYARPSDGTPETVDGLVVGDLLAYKTAAIRRGEMEISVTGDVTPAQLKDYLERYIVPLPGGSALAPEPDDAVPALARRADKTLDVPQTVVYFALPGVARSSKEYYVAYVMNHLFGGGALSSRLSAEIREKRGLAYYASSDLADYDKAALLVGSFATRNEQAQQAIDVLKETVAKAGAEGFSREEFDEGVAYLTGAFPAKLTSNRSVTAYLESMQHYQLGRDYLEKRNDYLRAVTLEQVNALAKSLFKPENLLIITAGHPVSETKNEK